MPKPSRQKARQISYPKVDLPRLYRKMAKGSGNPYGIWDSGLNPRYLLWELYKQPVCQLSDERPYSTRALQHLIQYGQLIDGFAEIEDATQEDDDSMPTFFGDGSAQNQRFIYRDNLITATLRDDMTYTLEFYHPVSKSCVQADFGKWILERKGESKVSILVSRNGNLVTNKVSFAPPVIQDIDLNYGTGFTKKYEALVAKLNERKSGIILVHGSPGSGKSTMFKHLSSIIDREWIFIPPNLADRLASPDFISLLMNKKEAVLILEDAEQAVQSRENVQDTGSISTLLNLSDGILGSLLSITCVVSFNFNRDGIDPALLRPGRLLMDIDFPPLSIEDAQRLSDKLGFDRKVTTPMTLAEIYNQKVDTNYVPPPPARQMGFHTILPIQTATLDSQKDKEKVVKT